MQLLFALALFWSAFLLFLVQPMVARMVLPLLGGTPAVWATCMVFFQAALLAGYAYAHAAPDRLGRRHVAYHLALLALAFAFLPVRILSADPPAESFPGPWLIGVLAASVGLPFFALAATSPLLQRWYAASGRPRAEDPYFLYAASNAGSLLALLAYPLLVEPNWTLAEQGRAWALGFAVTAVLIGLCALAARRAPGPATGRDPGPEPGGVTLAQRLRWLALAFVPSSLLLGVTTYLSTDVVAVPLLWAMPLALYLLSYIVAFSRLPAGVHTAFCTLLPVTVAGLIWLRWETIRHDEVPTLACTVALHLGAFFVAATACHGELARTRPRAARLTEFYLITAAGGVLGGLFNALLAPAFFDRVVEYPLVFAAACLLAPGVADPAARPRAHAAGVFAWVAVAAVGGWALHTVYAWTGREETLHRERNFFGVLRVWTDPLQRVNVLTHGTTLHGAQIRDPAKHSEPLTYYHRRSPVARIITARRPPRVGVIGLGAGTLAAYAGPGQEWTFYEIDPAVERIARDRRFFTYLSDAEARGARVRVVLGDARLSLNGASDGTFDLLVVDAFSSDAIPIHLLTREALALYLRKLAPDGLLAFHITNRYLRLAPVLGALTRDAGLVGLRQFHSQLTTAEVMDGKEVSHWAVIARHPSHLGALVGDRGWSLLPDGRGRPVWTDDYSSLVEVFAWDR